ncbi:IS30 family transposase [Nakamurella sp. A5-74]|uniref:IS30 family transposase n=1 Tax=Nakamurella sp. A5-74 TaxID=3158264 RepID=A0AAU8DU32_9ACTN
MKAIEEAVRVRALALLAEGVSCMEAARRVGVARTSVQLWAKVAGMTFVRGRVGGLVSCLVTDRDEGFLDCNGRLTYQGRMLIAVRWRDGCSQARIAAELRVHRSTVKREIDARTVDGRYLAAAAQVHADKARRRPKPAKLRPGTWLRDVVREGLDRKFSPQQISCRLRMDFPEDHDVHVSHETIYQALYVQGAGALRHELTVEKALRQGRTTRLPRSKLPARGKRTWIGDAKITARPAEAADRAVPGHWEGDLVIGGKDGLSSALITLVERTTRYLLIERITVHDSATVTDRLTAMIGRLPTSIWRSLTWDQGIEMREHAKFTVATGCPVYFCDPHSPWQRPTNENSNGLIRDFFPKGTDFNDVTDAQVAEAERLLNIRPRKVLGYATPSEKLLELLDVATTG